MFLYKKEISDVKVIIYVYLVLFQFAIPKLKRNNQNSNKKVDFSRDSPEGLKDFIDDTSVELEY